MRGIKASLALFVCLTLFLGVGTVFATSEPEVRDALPTAGVTVNATATVGPYGPFLWPKPAIIGAGSINVECISATGDADVLIEVLAPSSINADTPVSCWSEGKNKSIVTSSSLTDFGAEGEWMIALPLCASQGYYVQITGVNSNPADTLCKANMLIQ